MYGRTTNQKIAQNHNCIYLNFDKYCSYTHFEYISLELKSYQRKVKFAKQFSIVDDYSRAKTPICSNTLNLVK